MHIALARKYRPRLFADLIGQEHVARALRGAVEQHKVAHGYLLCGPRGVGKTTAARILAMALNCETRHAGQPTSAPGEPCGECTSCQRIWSGSSSLDVVEIDAASNRGVDDARDLRERAMYAASQEGRSKIYIVDEAHMLTREAWNTLLKVLEEPPPRVVFVFATTEPHKITNAAAPVMSRLQRFDFRRMGPAAIGKRILEVARAESIALEADAAALIARLANGGMRDALSVLDQVTAFGEGAVSTERVRDVLGVVGDDVFAELLDIVLERKSEAVFPFVAKLVEAGVDLVAFTEGCGDLWRAALAVRLGAAPDGISSHLESEVRRRVESADLAPGDLLRVLRALEESETAIAKGNAPRRALELLIVRWTLMDRTVEIEELLKAGSRIEDRGSRGGPAGGPGDDRGSRDSSARRTMREAAASAGSPAQPTEGPVARPPIPDPQSSILSLASARARWPEVLDALRDRKMLVAEALTEAEVAAVDGPRIALRPVTANPIVPETIRGKRQLVETAAARVLGTQVQIVLYDDTLPPPQAEEVPRRLTVSGAKAERLKALRGKDPALDSAMDALDLELLE